MYLDAPTFSSWIAIPVVSIPLNVTGCTSLTDLVCNQCPLVSLDLSTCSALVSLVCFSCASLITLDLTGCSALTNLNCSNTFLTTLDLSDMPAAIASVNASVNPNLTTVTGADFATVSAGLDFNNCPVLTGLSFPNLTSVGTGGISGSQNVLMTTLTAPNLVTVGGRNRGAFRIQFGLGLSFVPRPS